MAGSIDEGVQPVHDSQNFDIKHGYTTGLDEKGSNLPEYTPSDDSVEMAHAPGLTEEDYEGKPTEEERVSLRRVAGSIPTVAYVICAVEFAERASYYGVSPLISVRCPVLETTCVAQSTQIRRTALLASQNLPRSKGGFLSRTIMLS